MSDSAIQALRKFGYPMEIPSSLHGLCFNSLFVFFFFFFLKNTEYFSEYKDKYFCFRSENEQRCHHPPSNIPCKHVFPRSNPPEGHRLLPVTPGKRTTWGQTGVYVSLRLVSSPQFTVRERDWKLINLKLYLLWLSQFLLNKGILMHNKNYCI